MRKTAISMLAVALCLTGCQKFTLEPKPEEPYVWMEAIPDDTPVTEVSIPGAHDAGTASLNTPIICNYAKTQALSIAGLWEHGVRAFDLRPAVKNGKLEIFHDKYDAGISFAGAVNAIAHGLDKAESEFAIVIIRHEEEGDDNDSKWAGLLLDYIEGLPSERVMRDFHPGIKVGDIRGRILFLVRNLPVESPLAANISGWYSGTDISRQKSAGIGSGTLWVQDYYDPEGSEDKLSAVEGLMDDFADYPSVWCINHTSGYVKTGLGLPDYGANCENVNAVIADKISVRQGPVGIIMMDFAGAKTYKSYSVSGDRLLKSVIENNL